MVDYVPQPVPEFYEILAEKDADIRLLWGALLGVKEWADEIELYADPNHRLHPALKKVQEVVEAFKRKQEIEY